jgi:serine/threonine-protein kinase RsbW
MTSNGQTVTLEICSTIDMLDSVQVVADRMGRIIGFDGETLHWVGMAVRESVINAIKHGNDCDAQKRVFIEFTSRPAIVPTELVIRVRDQGKGFDPETVANPLAPENVLRSCGRGIFMMRSFMDEVSIERARDGGMEVRMVKRLSQ